MHDDTENVPALGFITSHLRADTGGKDLMSSSEKETIKQNQACQEEALCRIIDLRVMDAIASEPATGQL